MRMQLTNVLHHDAGQVLTDNLLRTVLGPPKLPTSTTLSVATVANLLNVQTCPQYINNEHTAGRPRRRGASRRPRCAWTPAAGGTPPPCPTAQRCAL